MPKAHIVYCPKCKKYHKMRITHKISKHADEVICRYCGYKTKWVIKGG